MSHYYYFSHNASGRFGTTEDKMNYLTNSLSREVGKFEMDYLRTPMEKTVNRNGGLTQLQPDWSQQAHTEREIEKVFAEYEFVGVSERFDESMVVRFQDSFLVGTRVTWY